MPEIICQSQHSHGIDDIPSTESSVLPRWSLDLSLPLSRTMFPSSLIHSCAHGASESRTGAVLADRLFVVAMRDGEGREASSDPPPFGIYKAAGSQERGSTDRTRDTPSVVREGVRGAVESGDVVRSRQAFLLPPSSSSSSSLSSSSKRIGHDGSSRDHSLPGTSWEIHA